MPKTIKVIMEVEELALGPVILKIHVMPGVVGFALDLGEGGGMGAGRKQLEDKVAAKIRDGGRNNAQLIVQMLMEGPKHIDDMLATIGGKRSSFYTATSKLKQGGLAEKTGGGFWQLTAKAKTQLNGAMATKAPQSVPALPAPKRASKVSHGPKGRATPGSGNIVLKTILSEGPKTPVEIRIAAGQQGVSPKSISGVLDRAKKNGLIKKNGAGYVLTAKGEKIEATEAAHG